LQHSQTIVKIQSLTLTSPAKLRLFLQRERGGTVLKPFRKQLIIKKVPLSFLPVWQEWSVLPFQQSVFEQDQGVFIIKSSI
jgi:hypothetical protein